MLYYHKSSIIPRKTNRQHFIFIQRDHWPFCSPHAYKCHGHIVPRILHTKSTKGMSMMEEWNDFTFCWRLAVGNCWQSFLRKVSTSSSFLPWLTWSSWVARTMTLHNIFDWSSEGLTRGIIVASLHICPKWQIIPESYSEQRRHISHYDLLLTYHFTLNENENLITILTHGFHTLKTNFCRISLENILLLLDQWLLFLLTFYKRQLAIDWYYPKQAVSIDSFSRSNFTGIWLSLIIERNFSIVYWQYWQILSFSFFWIACWDQIRSEQWSMESHSRELLNDEHQYDGPQVHRWLPTMTAGVSVAQTSIKRHNVEKR